MKPLFYAALVSGISFVSTCEKQPPIFPDSHTNTGTLYASITLGRVGALAKSASIDMTSLHIVFSAKDQDTITDTLALTGGYTQRTESKVYSELLAWINGSPVEWTLYVEARDKKNRTIHYGDTTFIIPPNDTAIIRLVLNAHYSMLEANFFSIPAMVNRCALYVDGTIEADSAFREQTLAGDFLKLTFDYLTASPEGVSHRIGLKVYGDPSGTETLIFTGETTFVARSGKNESCHIPLKYCSDSDLSNGTMAMAVTLGSISATIVNGKLLDEYIADTIFVDSAAQGVDDGTNWKNAYNNLQKALESAYPGSIICIAKGTYYPDTTDWRISFILTNGIKIYGGFKSGGGSRSPSIYKTILSGEIQGDGDSANNSMTVIKTRDTDTSCSIDGITIMDGHGIIDCSGGLDAVSSSLIVNNCVFAHNIGANVGGAIRAPGGAPTLSGCIFINNLCEKASLPAAGGAVYMDEGTLSNCAFSSNACIGKALYDAFGGALFITHGILINCTFSDNRCSSDRDFQGKEFGGTRAGGAVYLESGILTNCTFSENVCECSGDSAIGGAVYLGTGTTLVNNCTFNKNYSFGRNYHSDTLGFGEAVGAHQTGNHFLTNCIIWRGSPYFLYNRIISGKINSIKNCCIQDGITDSSIVIDSLFTDDPLLGELGDHGGIVPTIPLDPASLARNRGTIAVPDGIDISTDARGFPRRDGKPDIGSFEIQ